MLPSCEMAVARYWASLDAYDAYTAQRVSRLTPSLVAGFVVSLGKRAASLKAGTGVLGALVSEAATAAAVEAPPRRGK